MNILHTIYNNILEGEKYINNLQIHTEKKENKEINHDLLKKFDQTFERLFPKEILTYIKKVLKNNLLVHHLNKISYLLKTYWAYFF